MDPNTPLDWIREFGGLGIAGYLVLWVTRKLNGKLDRLAVAVERSADRHNELERAISENTAAQRALVRKLDRIPAR